MKAFFVCFKSGGDRQLAAGIRTQSPCKAMLSEASLHSVLKCNFPVVLEVYGNSTKTDHKETI
jgi:hypothetical protein